MAAPVVPAGPKGSWLTGNLRDFRSDPLGFLTRLARDYGDAARFRVGPRWVYLFSHPDLIEEVLVKQARNFVKSHGLQRARVVLGNGLLISEGDFWLRQRRLMQPAFHRERIRQYASTMVAYTARMLDTWRDGETRDVHADMMHLTMAIAAKTLFNADVAAAADRVGQALATVMDGWVARVTTPPVVDLLPTPGRRRFLRAVQDLNAVVYEIIAQRRRSGEDPGDLLSMLMHARDEDGTRMTDRQLRDEVMTLFLAGHETTANALAWALYLLARHPEAVERLEAEVDSALGGRPPAADDLPRLPYTEMVILESMRLYPPAWVLGREAVRDCEIGGYAVPKGTTVLVSQWVMHRHPSYFAEPERFWPERWADGLAKRLPGFAYFPFGGGGRICIGKPFAMMEAVLVLAAVVQRFRLVLAPDHPVVPEPVVTLRPRYGIRMTLHRR